jgi:hypothetical protein
VSVLYLRLLIATLVFSSFSFCLADYELNQLNGNKKKYNNNIHYKLRAGAETADLSGAPDFSPGF